MKLEKYFILIALAAIAAAIPVATTAKNRTNQLKIERTEKAQLKFQFNSVERQLNERDNQLKHQIEVNQDLERQKQDLNGKLQAKLKRQEQARLAVQKGTTAPISYIGGNCEQWRPIASKYPWNVDVALKVMKAESGCNPNAVSPANYDGLRDHGLMQIHGEAIYDPAANIARGYAKYAARKWQPWSVCTKGIVACYL